MLKDFPPGFMLYARYNIDGCFTRIRRLFSHGETPTYKDIEIYAIPIADYALDRYEDPIKILEDISSMDSYRNLSSEHKKWLNDAIKKQISNEDNQ